MFSKIQQELDFFSTYKNDILDAWMSYPVVRETLKRHSIDVDFYKEKFATKVFDYAVGVIKSENELGQCPVIVVMLILFKKKKIPLSDVFIICVHLKNALICFIHKHSKLNNSVITEISQLMDFNFKGVIDEYIILYYDKSFVPNSTSLQLDSTETTTSIIPNMKHVENTNSASRYLQEVEIDNEAIAELSELEDDALDSIDAQELITQDTLLESAGLFTSFSRVLNSLYEFEELSYTLTILSDLLNKANFAEMDIDTQSYIHTYLKAIISDLQSWRISIFVTQEAEDVHYLDKTLLSSIAQLQITLMPEDEHTGGEEVEFF